jgi:hypothetical protein
VKLIKEQLNARFVSAFAYFLWGLCGLSEPWIPFLIAIDGFAERLLSFFPSEDTRLSFNALRLVHKIWDYQFRNNLVFDVDAALELVTPFASMSTRHAMALTSVLETLMCCVLPDADFAGRVCDVLLVIIRQRTEKKSKPPSGKLHERVSVVATEMLRHGCDLGLIGDHELFITLLRQVGAVSRSAGHKFRLQVFDLITTVLKGAPEDVREGLLSAIEPMGLMSILTSRNPDTRDAGLRMVTVFIGWDVSIAGFFVAGDVFALLADYFISELSRASGPRLWLEFCHALCASQPVEFVTLCTNPPNIDTLKGTGLYAWHLEQIQPEEPEPPWYILSCVELFMLVSDFIGDQDVTECCVDLILGLLRAAEVLSDSAAVLEALAACPDLLEAIHAIVQQGPGPPSGLKPPQFVAKARLICACVNEALE